MFEKPEYEENKIYQALIWNKVYYFTLQFPFQFYTVIVR